MIIIPLILCSITTGVASVGNADNFGATLIKIIPSNIFESLMQGQMLSIIFFAILFGFFITKVDEKPRILMTRLTTRT